MSGTPIRKCSIDMLERVQRRAARFVCNDYSRNSSVSKMLKDLGWTPLEERRAKIKLKIFHKGKNGTIAIPTDNLSLKSRNLRGGSVKYNLPSSRIDSHLHSFFPSVLRLWNYLPAEVQMQQSAEPFDHQLKKCTIRSYYCDKTISYKSIYIIYIYYHIDFTNYTPSSFFNE